MRRFPEMSIGVLGGWREKLCSRDASSEMSDSEPFSAA